MNKIHSSDDDVEYLPPDTKEIEQYARQVCQQMGDQYTDDEFLREFKNFLQVAINTTLKTIRQTGKPK